MISISSFQSTEQAKNYYKKENYYQKNSERGFFHGKAFSQLNLDYLQNKKVYKETYNKLLQAINPATNKKMTYSKNRAGFDITFSAPKSLSILIEFLEATNRFEDAKLLREAHEKAVQKTMQEIEDKYLYTRIKDPQTKELVKVKAVGAMYASFQHDTTRKSQSNKIDPQLHTHNFIFNIVTYIDPFTNELKTATIENFEVFKNKVFLGTLYRKELANNLKELNIELEVTDAKNAFFELKDFDKKLLDEFSNRSKEIKEVLEQIKQNENVTNEAALKNEINKQIKQAKARVDREALYQENLRRLENIVSKEKFEDYIKSIIKEQKALSKEEKEAFAKEAIEKAAKTLTEYQSTFSREELLKEAFKLTLTQNLAKEELELALKNSDNILQLDNNTYSTLEILEAEKFVIENINNKKRAIFDNENEIETFINEKYNTMTEDQKKMFKNILTFDNQYVIIQGDAGAGKTYSLKALNEFLKEKNSKKELIGLSFTGKAAKGLETESGIKSKTVSSFLLSANKSSKDDELNKRKEKILIVDEAGLVGSKQFAELIKIAKENNYKVIFIGDIKQFSAIQAGNIFKEAQKYSNNVIELTTSLRQKDEILKEIVYQLKQKNIEAVEELLEENNLITEDKKENLINQIADEYFANNEDLLIVASRNEDKSILNELIRSKKTNLKNSKKFKINEMLSFTDTSKYYANSYLNSKIKFMNSVKNFDNRIEYKVIAKKDDYILTIEDNKQDKKELNLLKYADDIVAFREKEKEFAAGDKILFTKNDKDLDVKNGEIATITNIKDNKIYLDNNKVINLDEYNYFDYAYCITDYKAQGVTANNIAVLADPNIATFNSFYTQITRAKYNVKVFTQNKELLFQKIEELSKKRSAVAYIKLNKINKKEKGVENDAKRNVGQNLEKSGSYDREIAEFRREVKNIRKIRSRFKKFVCRAKQRLQLFFKAAVRRRVVEK